MINTSHRPASHQNKCTPKTLNTTSKSNQNPIFFRPSPKFFMSTVPRRAILLDPYIQTQPLQQKPQCSTISVPLRAKFRDSEVSLRNEIELPHQIPLCNNQFAHSSYASPLNPVHYPTFGKIDLEPLVGSVQEITPIIQFKQSTVKPIQKLENIGRNYKKRASDIIKLSQFEKLLENTEKIRKLLKEDIKYYDNSNELAKNYLLNEYEEAHRPRPQQFLEETPKKSKLRTDLSTDCVESANKRYLQVISFGSRATTYRDSYQSTKQIDISTISFIQSTKKQKKGIFVSQRNIRCKTVKGDINSNRHSLYNRTARVQTTFELENQQADHKKSSCCD